MTVISTWPDVSLPEAVDFLDSQRRPVRVGDRAKMRGSIPYYGASGIVDYVDSYLFDEELILLGEDGENILSRVVPLAFKIAGKSWVNNHAHVLRPKAEFDVDFLTAYLESLDYSGLNTGTAQPKLNKQSCSTIRVVKPPLAQQRRIALALRDADDLIATLQRMIAKKKSMKLGMMQQLLAGRTRLPGFGAPWSSEALGDIAAVNMGQSPLGLSYNTSGRGLPLVQGNADIRDRRTIERVWTTAPTKRCRVGDVVLTVRAPVGYAALATRDACLGRGICAISAGPDNGYLYYALVYAEPRWRVYEQGSTFTAVNSTEVRSFSIPWPSDAEERKAIGDALDNVDAEVELLRSRLAKARDVKRGMLQELLTGHTRLPVNEGAA